MGRIVLIACLAGLTLSLSSPAFADDPESCDMLCRLKSYLATDHMAPAPAEGAASKTSASKHARNAAARKPKPAVAAAHAPAVPQAAEAKPAPAAAKTAKLLPGRPKAVADADAKSVPSPERHRSAEKAVVHPAKPAVATRAEPAAAPRAADPLVVVDTLPKRAATRVATLAAGRPPARPSVQPATPAETTTSSTTTIPGSAPLVAAGFR